MWNCHSWPLDATTWGVDLPLDLPLWANISSHSRNVISPFLTTRCQYWGVDLPVDLPVDLQIWPLTVEMWNCHSWPLDATTGGLDLPVDMPLDLQIWPLTVEMSYCYTWALDISYWGADLPLWSATMTSNSGIVKSPFLINRCQDLGGRSATWSANMSSNSRNVKSPFFTTRCHY